MPELESTSWETVPEGLTQLIAAATGISRYLAYLALVETATFFKYSNVSGKPLLAVVIKGLSIIPVSDTPSNLSSAVLVCQIFLR